MPLSALVSGAESSPTGKAAALLWSGEQDTGSEQEECSARRTCEKTRSGVWQMGWRVTGGWRPERADWRAENLGRGGKSSFLFWYGKSQAAQEKKKKTNTTVAISFDQGVRAMVWLLKLYTVWMVAALFPLHRLPFLPSVSKTCVWWGKHNAYIFI